MNLVRKLVYFFMLGFSIPGLSEQLLNPVQYFNTTGARELTPFNLHGEYYIAAAQLAKDIPGTPSTLDSGDADVDVIIYKKQGEQFSEYQHIPSHGNAGATFFSIGEDSYIAVASLNSGPKPPLNHLTYSMLYRWDGHYFYPVQQFLTYAARQSYYFTIGTRHFLAFANGSGHTDDKSIANNTPSIIYEWDGKQFRPFQTIPSLRGESFKFFNIDRTPYLAFADHFDGAVLYRWDGSQFIKHQQFKGAGARAFEFFSIKDRHYLAFANIKTDSLIYQWNGKQFIRFQNLQGPGSRNFAYFFLNEHHYLMRVNYRIAQGLKYKTDVQSQLYQWTDGKFSVIQNIPTYGGVSAHVFTMDDLLYMTLANGFNSDGQFKVNSVLYEITQGRTIEFG
ncbi:hypothetical protein [Legionella quateirensis]|uniref:EPTP domain n=1 Tax=Legionella quateirensis TaxID=45072 RepID=A0A378L1W5_9GAMM|nr:hypothetical protein [Legionella quateirensis]KTD43231.1 EPTP domain protein [Legionella quateirensis]STY18110.1 EPTP domain [Legionella quateirensis]